MDKTFLDIPITNLQIDPRYQRGLDLARSKAIAENLNENLFGVPLVSKREVGYYVIDGQHRIKALALTGYKGRVHCEVIEGLAVHEEAATFVRVNQGRSAIRPYDCYNAKLTARDESTVATDKIVRAHKLHVTKGTTTVNGIRAVKQLETAFAANVLPQVLSVLVGWAGAPVDKAFVEAPVLTAVTVFLMAYPKATITDLVSKLATTNPVKLMSRIRLKKETLQSTSAQASVLVLREIYNFRRHSGALK